MTTDTQTTTPRVWVGCLGCYNSGNLNGVWVDGSEASEVVAVAGLATLENVGGYIAPRCKMCFGDEFWVFDHENFGGLISGECSPQEAQEKAELLESIEEDRREAFIEYAEHVGAEYADVRRFEDAYMGQYDEAEDFARELLESTGDLSGDSFLSRYFDWEAYTRDLFFDYFMTDSGYVFSNY
jgi:antirestriction protein